jgi:hypothetical protein
MGVGNDVTEGGGFPEPDVSGSESGSEPAAKENRRKQRPYGW